MISEKLWKSDEKCLSSGKSFHRKKQNDTENSSPVSFTAVPEKVIQSTFSQSASGSVTGEGGPGRPAAEMPKGRLTPFTSHYAVNPQHKEERRLIIDWKRSSCYKQLLRSGSTFQRVDKC